ncbi:MAG TPA: 3-deoxy-manno-octulosonate cytidylyltransferase [Steroidobacteraceae bacterium]|nr:3-deoxy-manno-octulosonate cytidylyltransferase [Steroidobacteraceae bacterium]
MATESTPSSPSSSTEFRVVVPARYGSTRLPGKPLLMLAGRPMIEWVYRRACRSSARQVIIATDDARILEAAHRFGARALMTAATHPSGTDRIAEVARLEGWGADEIVVNVQGDEPLLPEALIDQVAATLLASPEAQLATLAVPIGSPEELQDPNVVKVVSDLRQRALYFSRAPIPCDRDGAGADAGSVARRHLGIYAYRVGALLQWAALSPTPLERLERLEQLRALEHGMHIRVVEAVAIPGGDVNAAGDVGRVEALLASERFRV